MTNYDFQDDMSEEMPFDVVAALSSRPSLPATTTNETENRGLPLPLPPVGRLAQSKRSAYEPINQEAADQRNKDDEQEEDVERWSSPMHSRLALTGRERPKSAAIVTAPSLYGYTQIARSTSQSIYQETYDRKNLGSSPPRTERAHKPPGTPNTISLSQDEEDSGGTLVPNFFRDEGQGENFSCTWETIFPNIFREETHGVDSSSTSATVLHENLAKIPEKQMPKTPKNYVPKTRQKQLSLATKSAVIAMLLVIILGIIMVVGAYFILNEDDESADLVPADSNIFSWPTSRPTVSGTSNQWPTVDLEMPPTSGTPSPSLSPTSKPTRTTSPTTVFNSMITDFLFQEDNLDRVSTDNPATDKAVQWLVDEATVAQSILFPLDQKYRQRFGILLLYFSVDRSAPWRETEALPNLGMRNQDECSWIGMRCDENGMVTEIKLTNRQLYGRLPDEWLFFPSLTSIDLSENKLQGSIPESLYDLLGLEEVFLYNNQLTGTISSKIGNLWSLRWFNLSRNRLSGSIPLEIASAANRVRSLRHFNVHRNQMTGSIPSNMRLRQLYYMDLGRNQFSGTVPPDFGTESVRLRHLYLDHNNFEGTFPSQVLNAGDGRLKALTLDNNQFSGTFPGNHQYNYTMVELTIQNNNFVSMERETCQLDVFSGGNLVEFKSNCLVCRCGVALMCKHCVL